MIQRRHLVFSSADLVRRGIFDGRMLTEQAAEKARGVLTVMNLAKLQYLNKYEIDFF